MVFFVSLSAYAKVSSSASTKIDVAIAGVVKLIVHLNRNADEMQILICAERIPHACAVFELAMQIGICKTCDKRPILCYRNTNLKSEDYRTMMGFVVICYLVR